MTQGAVSRGFNWTRFGRGDAEAEASARGEAMELARGLALQTIAFSKDAVVEEYQDRVGAIAETVWPEKPLAGYGLHSSLGAYAVTKVAVGWAPSLGTGLRHEPHERPGLLDALEEQGIGRVFALAVLGDWNRVERGFIADQGGLEISRIAGLAECSLSRQERARALSQVAYSGRDLARLASSVSVLSAMRTVMPMLPPTDLGTTFSAAMTAIALNRHERALDLLGERPDRLADRTLAEIAFSLLRLERGALPELDDDGPMLVPQSGDESSASAEEDDTGDVSKPGGDEDDVLEIVEEKVDHGASSAPPESGKPWLPKPPRWWAPQDAPTDVEEKDLSAWARKLEEGFGMVARRGSLLGLKPFPPAKSLMPMRAAPDEGFVGLFAKNQAPAWDALFPPVRGVLRAILAAAAGRAPTMSALKHAGDYAWILHRARALAAILRGELDAAREEVKMLPPDASPEGQWTSDRWIRFNGRREICATSHEALGFAASMIGDLVHHLGRTLAGTTPRTGAVRTERPS
jgi:hypothetical protein